MHVRPLVQNPLLAEAMWGVGILAIDSSGGQTIKRELTA